MDFVSKALGSLNMGLPFTLGERVENGISGQPWKLYDAVLRKDASNVSVFEYEEMYEAAAQNATAALRKLKLPGVVKHIETVTAGKRVYIVTERVAPFNVQALSNDARKFVLKSVLKALETMSTVAKCKHNCICISTVLQSSATGQPLLVGFDLATIDGLSVPAYASSYTSTPVPPSEGWTSQTLDTYQFGMLVADLLPEESRLISSLKSAKRPTIVKLGSSNSADIVLRNPISDLVAEIGQAVLLAPHDLQRLCEQIDQIVPSLYPALVKGTFLPELLRTKNANILRTNLVLIASLTGPETADPTAPKKTNTALADDDPVVLYLVDKFQSMDRVVRLELLRFLPQYILSISDRVIQQKIMPKMVFGFGDNEVMVRKASVAATEYLATKLTARQLNSELLRMLAKTHNDADPDVRALTTTVLCRIAPRLDSRSVISTALGRALRDPVPRCRNAALRGVLQIDVPAQEIAEKLLGPTASVMLDKDPNVSAEAWRATDELLKKIRENATSTGPAAAPPPASSDNHSSNPSALINADLTKPISLSSSRTQTPDAPSAVPSPLSTLRRAAVKPESRDEGGNGGDIDAEEDAWGWEGDENTADADNHDQIEDAWGWDDDKNEEPDVDEDAWGW